MQIMNGERMKYQAYQACADMMGQFHVFARAFRAAALHTGMKAHPLSSRLAALQEVFSTLQLTHTRPAFRIDSVRIDDGRILREVSVDAEAVHTDAFGTLLHFRKAGSGGGPPVLLVAPMSGHFSTLLRDTVRTLLADHDVFITDWHNARDVPLAAGRFGLAEYVQYLITYLEMMGPGVHVVAVCQSCVAALAATALMAEDHHPAQPRSLTLMAGPIDTRVNPTRVNQLASSRSFQWFERNQISIVPNRHRGALRRVYPGFVQLAAFLSMNMERHVKSFRDLYNCVVENDLEKADAIRRFYNEYFAVSDLTAEFYLETVQDIFQEYTLPRGRMAWRGRIVNPALIRRTVLLTVEGERDDICSIGQTMAAQELCSGIPTYKKLHHMQAGVGHYGVFSGRRWEREIYPVVRDVILSSA